MSSDHAFADLPAVPGAAPAEPVPAVAHQVLRVMLPWPPASLSPNARTHWRALAKAKRAYRLACAWQARTQGACALVGADQLLVSMQFVPPDRRRRDLDNLIASMKSGLDGLADALGVDDARFALAAELLQHIGMCGFVKVEVKKC